MLVGTAAASTRSDADKGCRLYRQVRVDGTSLAIMLLVFVAAVEAQPVKVRVKGGDKAFRAQVVALLTDPSAPRASGGADAEIDLQKTGGARTKCGSAWTFLPGPTAAEIVAQFRAWLPGAMESRRAEKAARAEARARGLEARSSPSDWRRLAPRLRHTQIAARSLRAS